VIGFIPFVGWASLPVLLAWNVKLWYDNAIDWRPWLDMTVTIELDSETEQRLASSAERAGQPFGDYITQVLRNNAVEALEDADLTPSIALLAEQGHSFDWLSNEPDLYSIDDLKVRYR
jgi:predicted DNA-binding protein